VRRGKGRLKQRHPRGAHRMAKRKMLRECMVQTWWGRPQVVLECMIQAWWGRLQVVVECMIQASWGRPQVVVVAAAGVDVDDVVDEFASQHSRVMGCWWRDWELDAGSTGRARQQCCRCRR